MGQSAVWSKDHGNHAGQNETILIIVSLLYQFLAVSMPENKYMEIVKALVVVLAPDAPGENQFVYMSLSPEPSQPCDSTRFFLLGKVYMAHCCQLITEVWD